MTCDEFIFIYWNQYISLEKEFTKTFHYIALDNTNYSAYSQAYAKLMLEIGSEVDVIFKEYCKQIDTSFKTKYSKITRYKDSINTHNQDFISQTVIVENFNLTVQPWIEWNSLDAPYWWTAYNKIKHNRTSMVEIDNKKDIGYKFATQKYTLLGLSGLYQLMLYLYYKLASDEHQVILTPMPSSRLFKLVGGDWDKVSFYGEIALVYDSKTQSLNWVNSKLHY